MLPGKSINEKLYHWLLSIIMVSLIIISYYHPYRIHLPSSRYHWLEYEWKKQKINATGCATRADLFYGDYLYQLWTQQSDEYSKYRGRQYQSRVRVCSTLRDLKSKFYIAECEGGNDFSGLVSDSVRKTKYKLNYIKRPEPFNIRVAQIIM